MLRDWELQTSRINPVKKPIVSKSAFALRDNWVLPYEIPEILLVYNGPASVRKFSSTFCVYLSKNTLLTNTAYLSQTNSQTEICSKIIESRLFHYDIEHEMTVMRSFSRLHSLTDLEDIAPRIRLQSAQPERLKCNLPPI